MKTEEFKTIILKADEGKFLTQTKDVDITERIVSDTIALGRFSSPDDYKEITAEEAEAIKKEKEEALKEQEPKVLED